MNSLVLQLFTFQKNKKDYSTTIMITTTPQSQETLLTYYFSFKISTMEQRTPKICKLREVEESNLYLQNHVNLLWIKEHLTTTTNPV